MARQVFRLPSNEFNFADKKEVGKGAFGIVYSVSWKGKDKRVAVKVLHTGELDAKEALILTKIGHKNIADFYGVVTYENQDCLVTELADYGSLADILYGKNPPMKVTANYRLQWTLEIAEGLKYLHFDVTTATGHGDIKSDNILIFSHDKGTRAKIGDFGLAKELIQSETPRSFASRLWSAPEVLGMKAQSIMSDVWSFGATIVEMFTGQKPYAHISKQNENFLYDVKKGKLTPLSELTQQDLSKIPPIIRDILVRCFEANRANRISMKDVVSRLSDDQKPSPSGATGGGSASKAVAGESSSSSSSQMTHRFEIRKCFGDYKNFDLQLESWGAPTGKDLRAAVASRTAEAEEKLRMWQKRGTRERDGVEVVLVDDGWKYADEEGNAVSDGEVKDLHRPDIRDYDKLPSAGAQRLVIFVSKM